MAVCLSALAVFYLAGAKAHAARINTSKARADQSGYLWDAEQVYANWHGRTPEVLIGQRMRMPVYAGFLALFYTPQFTDAWFFEAAKQWNIRLSLVLVLLIGAIAWRHLPGFAATNLTLVIAFGYFVFKAGYVQPELLFYFLFFATFVAACRLIEDRRTVASVLWGIGVGALAGITYLTKAVVPPFIAILVTTVVFRALWTVYRSRRVPGALTIALRQLWWRIAAGAVVGVTFFAVIYPYAANSKRVFGAYLFNQNTTYYIWFDSGAEARAVMLPATDDEGRVSIPPDRLPNARTYWQSHTIGQIAAREWAGAEDLLTHSYDMYWFLKYVTLYLGFAIVLIVSRWRYVRAFLAGHAWLVAFLVVYASVYLPAIAMFDITSGTGSTRFLLAHVAPLLFALAFFISRPEWADLSWSIGGARIRPAHFQVLVAAVLAFDLVFTEWPRLMATYAGF